MELSLEAVALPPLFEDVAKTIRPLAETNSNRLLLTCDANISRVKADTVRLRQILLNLLSNAVKFTENGSIELSAIAEKGQIVMAVAEQSSAMVSTRSYSYDKPLTDTRAKAPPDSTTGSAASSSLASKPSPLRVGCGWRSCHRTRSTGSTRSHHLAGGSHPSSRSR